MMFTQRKQRKIELVVRLDATADVLDESVQSFGSGRPVRLDSSESPDPEQQQNGNSDDLSKTWTYGMSQAFSLHQRMASDPVTNYPLKVRICANIRNSMGFFHGLFKYTLHNVS